MRLINHDRQRRVLMLAKRLDELAAARRELLLQLETLDAQAGAVQLEHNALRNMDAPISILPDEVLAMIFEAGMHPRDSPPENASFDFSVLVTHVIQCWRNVAIATPMLWTRLRCITHGINNPPPYPEGRLATFLSRARPLPLDIDVIGFRDEDFSLNFLQLLSDHMGHCRHLHVFAESICLMRALKYISLQPMPLLESIDLGSPGALEFRELIFWPGVPRLTTASILDIDFTTMHYCLPAFSSLISLQLPYIDHPDYNSFRDSLMALPSLRHLDLYLNAFDIPSPPTHLPILLPNVLHLRVQGNSNSPPAIYNLLSCLQAANLVALSLTMSTDGEYIALNAHSFEPLFPSLQHLLLANAAHSAGDLVASARSFPNIGRLTFAPGENDDHLSLHNLHQTLGVIIHGADDDDTAGSNVHGALLWSKLQSIALPTSSDHFDVAALENMKGTILQLQVAGHPIRKLLLPNVHPAMVEMGEAIEIGEYYVDWPRVFDWT